MSDRPGAVIHCVGISHNKSSQVSFDPLPIFAIVNTGTASDARELRRYARKINFVATPNKR